MPTDESISHWLADDIDNGDRPTDMTQDEFRQARLDQIIRVATGLKVSWPFAD